MATIKQIAAELNISPSAVSRALNNSSEISEKTKQKVLAKAQELGYTPNQHAQFLVRQSSNVIGLMIPNISNSFFSQSAYGVEEIMKQSPNQIAYTSTERDAGRVIEFLNHAQNNHYKGLFITPDDWGKETENRLKTMTIPIVSLRRKPPEHIKIPFVDSNYWDGTVGAVKHLVENGHRDISFVATDFIVEDEKICAYKAAVVQNNLEEKLRQYPTTHTDNNRSKIGFRAMEQLLGEYEHLTAVIATDEQLAVGALEYLTMKGIRVPEDFSIISYDDRGISSVFCIQISTIQQPLKELGRQAGRMMLDMLDNPDYCPESVLLDTAYIERKSVGKAR